jgi:hypothetical protein
MMMCVCVGKKPLNVYYLNYVQVASIILLYDSVDFLQTFNRLVEDDPLNYEELDNEHGYGSLYILTFPNVLNELIKNARINERLLLDDDNLPGFSIDNIKVAWRSKKFKIESISYFLGYRESIYSDAKFLDDFLKNVRKYLVENPINALVDLQDINIDDPTIDSQNKVDIHIFSMVIVKQYYQALPVLKKYNYDFSNRFEYKKIYRDNGENDEIFVSNKNTIDFDLPLPMMWFAVSTIYKKNNAAREARKIILVQEMMKIEEIADEWLPNLIMHEVPNILHMCVSKKVAKIFVDFYNRDDIKKEIHAQHDTYIHGRDLIFYMLTSRKGKLFTTYPTTPKVVLRLCKALTLHHLRWCCGLSVFFVKRKILIFNFVCREVSHTYRVFDAE